MYKKYKPPTVHVTDEKKLKNCVHPFLFHTEHTHTHMGDTQKHITVHVKSILLLMSIIYNILHTLIKNRPSIIVLNKCGPGTCGRVAYMLRHTC